jgi:hypothetical protein
MTTPAVSKPLIGAEYLESLRDGREVWIDGEKVADVTEHPAFRNPVRMTARLYDSLHADAVSGAGVLAVPTDTGNGGYTHPFFRAPTAISRSSSCRPSRAWLPPCRPRRVRGPSRSTPRPAAPTCPPPTSSRRSATNVRRRCRAPSASSSSRRRAKLQPFSPLAGAVATRPWSSSIGVISGALP